MTIINNTPRLLAAVLSFATLTSCGQAQSEKQTKADAGENTCLLAYAEKYDELLTKDLVSAAAAADEDGMTIAYQKIHKDTKYHDVTYSWDSGRKKMVVGMEVPAADMVRLTGVSAITLERFQLAYRAVSEKDAAALKMKANDAIAGSTNDERIKERLKKLDDMGISKEDQQNMMESLTNGAQKMTEGFTPIDNIGDAATWNAKTNTMYVFKDGAMFELLVELGDSNRSLKVAGVVAKRLLEKSLKACR